jgi:effector-binding domain-containing protein
MKIVRRILFIILAIIALILGIAFLLPRHVQVERSKVIAADAAFVFVQVNTLKNWENWSPWHKLDPNMKIQYAGPEAGVGASYSWQSSKKNVGNGKLTILQSVPNDSIVVEMDFMENGKSAGIYRFVSQANATKVNWIMRTDLGNNPIARYFGLFMDKMVGPDFEKGLNNLDSLAKLNANAGSFTISEQDLAQRIVITVRDTCNAKTISKKLGSIYTKLSDLVKEKKMQVLKPPFAIYHHYAENQFDIEAGFEVNQKTASRDGVNCLVLPAGHAVCAKYYGPYEGTGKAYESLQKYIDEKKYKIAAPPIEEYVTDPTTEKNPSKWLTNIYYPVVPGDSVK